MVREMKTIIANFRRLTRAVLVDRPPEVDLDNVPGYLQSQRERAIFATFFFFTAVLVYNTFGRPYQQPFVFWFNFAMLAFNLLGILFILSGRFRTGLYIAIYSVMLINTILQFVIIHSGLDDPQARPPFVGGFFLGFYAIYMMTIAGLLLTRRHILLLGGSGLVFLLLAVLLVRRRLFTDLMLIPAAYIVAGMVFLHHFIGLFESLVARLIDLTRNLKKEVDARTRELSESEKRYRLLFENASVGVFHTSPEGRLVYANDALTRLFGFDSVDAMAATVTSVADHYAEPDERARIVAVAMQQESPIKTEMRFRRRNGTVFLADFRLRVVRDGAGAVEGFEGFIDDITARHEAENQLRTAKEKAEEANLAKSLFLANVSHDLRTPLNSVLGFTEILLRDEADERRRRLLDLVRSSGSDLLKLINDLLDVARIESGEMILRPQATRIREIAETAGRNVSFEAERKHLSLSITVAGDLPEFLFLDAGRVRQIMDNLLVNAVRYTREGRVSLALNRKGGELEIRVEDTGPGIPLKEQERIFDAFHRHMPDSESGTGLGLALVRRLAKVMLGEVQLDSAPGRGSRFTVLLPLIETGAPDLPVEQSHVSLPDLAGRRGLVVDDILGNIGLIAEALQPTGIELREATTGGEALELARSFRPEIIILDIRLPDIDGYEVFRRLRADEATRAIPVIAVTASATMDEAARATGAGFASFISKPIDIGRLQRECGRLLAGGQAPVRAAVVAAIAADLAALDDANRSELIEALGEAVGTGGLRQAEECGELIAGIGQAAGRAALAAAGARLATAAADCRVAEISAELDLLKEAFPS
jgi:PAS domain S-box-containing protein